MTDDLIPRDYEKDELSQLTSSQVSPAIVYLARLSKRSRVTMAQSLNTIARFLKAKHFIEVPWHKLRYEHTQAIRAAMRELGAHTTANRHLSALKGVLKECWRLGLMSAEDLARATDLEAITGSRPQAGRVLTKAEIDLLLDPASEGLQYPRDRLLVLLGLLCGMRREEIASLQLKDHHLNGFHVLGKGNKVRIVPTPFLVEDALERWLEFRDIDPGPLLFHITKTGKIDRRPLTESGVYYLLKKIGREVGISNFSPHDLRRTYITSLLNAGIDAFIVQELAGHAKPETTKKYDRRGEEAKQAAVDKVFGKVGEDGKEGK